MSGEVEHMVEKTLNIPSHKWNEKLIRLGERFDVTAEDFMTQQTDNLLSNGIADGFMKAFLKFSQREEDERFLDISSHAIVRSQRMSESSEALLLRLVLEWIFVLLTK